MNLETKDRLLGMYLAVMDGRDPRPHVMMMDGLECVEGYKIIRSCDELLRRQWAVMGSPDPQNWDPLPVAEPALEEQLVEEPEEQEAKAG